MRFGTFSYNQSRPWITERQAFEELLDQIEMTERLGFHEAWFAEHHYSDYGMLASPNLIIAALARHTRRLGFRDLGPPGCGRGDLRRVEGRAFPSLAQARQPR